MAEVRVDRSIDDADVAALWPVYRSAFGEHDTFEAWRKRAWDAHRARRDFRVARAFRNGIVVGFAYGYTGDAGQWFTDNARAALGADVAGGWLGGHFELVSIGVVESARRAGIGRALMRAVLDDVTNPRLLLMTSADPSDPARRLYASEGWEVLGSGIGEDTVIMGKRSATT
jgi:ribosomal protein S18 acetylase RimI-like enzyme